MYFRFSTMTVNLHVNIYNLTRNFIFLWRSREPRTLSSLILTHKHSLALLLFFCQKVLCCTHNPFNLWITLVESVTPPLAVSACCFVECVTISKKYWKKLYTLCVLYIYQHYSTIFNFNTYPHIIQCFLPNKYCNTVSHLKNGIKIHAYYTLGKNIKKLYSILFKYYFSIFACNTIYCVPVYVNVM